jgi:DNA-binding SARP family transcriptional activator
MGAIPNEPLSIRLLGGFCVSIAEREIPRDAWRRRRPAELLKLIASAPRRSLTRDQVIERLWPDKDSSSGANNLHRALHDLRKVLGGGWLALDGGVVRLSGDVWVDVEQLDADAACDDPERQREALALYHGDLCPNDEVAWLEVRRRALRRRFIEGSLGLARRCLTLGQPASAIGPLERAIEVEPPQEEAHRLLMRAFSDAGRKRDALEQYTRCAEALAVDDADPSDATVRLHREINSAGPSANADRPDWRRISRRIIGTAEPSPMRGRDADRACLAEMVEGLVAEVDPCGGVLLVMGEAGSGKSRLAAEMARLAAEQGAVVFAGATVELANKLPFAPYIEAFVEHFKAVGRSPADDPFASLALREAPRPDDTLRLFQAVERTLLDAPDAGPVVLIVEDLHWADHSSLQLFQHLARATRKESLLLIGTCRVEEVVARSQLHVLLTALHREPMACRLTLQPLSRDETAQQLADILEHSPACELVKRLHRLSGGNPLFNEELAHAHLETGSAGQSVPESLSDVVHERIGRLGDGAETLLRFASVAGPSFRFEWVRDAAQLGQQQAVDALDAAMAAKLLDEEESGYRFRHALFRAVVYAGLSRQRRKTMHGAIADAIVSGDKQSNAMAGHAATAHHLRSAGRSAEALPHLLRAGRAAMDRSGLQEALAFFESALTVMGALKGRPASEYFLVHRRMGAIFAALSKYDEALASFDLALQTKGVDDGWLPSDNERITVLRLAAGAHMNIAQLDAADRLLQQAMDLADAKSAEFPELLCNVAHLRWNQGRAKDAYATAQRAVAEADRSGDREALAKAYEMLALACHSLGEWREGMDFVEKREEIVGHAVDVAEVFDAHL